MTTLLTVAPVLVESSQAWVLPRPIEASDMPTGEERLLVEIELEPAARLDPATEMEVSLFAATNRRAAWQAFAAVGVQGDPAMPTEARIACALPVSSLLGLTVMVGLFPARPLRVGFTVRIGLSEELGPGL